MCECMRLQTDRVCAYVCVCVHACVCVHVSVSVSVCACMRPVCVCGGCGGGTICIYAVNQYLT